VEGPPTGGSVLGFLSPALVHALEPLAATLRGATTLGSAPPIPCCAGPVSAALEQAALLPVLALGLLQHSVFSGSGYSRMFSGSGCYRTSRLMMHACRVTRLTLMS
jgi:hypothetical protein